MDADALLKFHADDVSLHTPHTYILLSHVHVHVYNKPSHSDDSVGLAYLHNISWFNCTILCKLDEISRSHAQCMFTHGVLKVTIFTVIL